MSPIPGTEVTLGEATSSRSTPTGTGTFFAVGLTERGPTTPMRITSMAEFANKAGARQSDSVLYDTLESYFRVGGNLAYVSRVTGPTPVTGTLTLVDRAGTPLNTLRVDAIGPGSWSSNVTIQVANGVGTNTFTLTIREGGVIQEVSPDLATPDEAVAWAQTSNYVRITNLSAATAAPNNNPAVAAATVLSTGTDDRSNATDNTWLTSLNKFDKDLGAGQVAMPGRTTSQSRTDLADHANDKNRVALVDTTDTGVIATLTALGTGLRAASTHEKRVGIFAPWVRIPGLTTGTTRSVPPSGIVAGLISALDAKTGNPNKAAAGKNGAIDFATGLTQNAWTEAERGQLNDAGVNVIREVHEQIKVYGWRSVASTISEAKWKSLGAARTVMAVAAEADIIAEAHAFEDLFPQGDEITKFGGDLSAMCERFYQIGALFGDTSEDAYSVNVSPEVNTIETIDNGELHAIIALKTSPFAERVYIEIVKVALSESVL